MANLCQRSRQEVSVDDISNDTVDENIRKLEKVVGGRLVDKKSLNNSAASNRS